MTAKTRNAIIVLCIALIIPVSGCTSGPVGDGGYGVIITDFAPEFTEYYLGEPVNFQVKIKNTGSTDASQVKVEILNLEGWESMGGDYCTFEKLIAPNPDMGTAGESKICTFRYRAPRELPQGLSFNYYPITRLVYSYESSTIKAITMASQSELRNIQDTGRALPADTVSSTQGPVSVSIETKGPIRFWEDLASVKFPIETKVTNTGAGTVSRQEAALGENVNMLWIGTDLSHGMELEEPYCGNREASLWQGRSFESVCKVNAMDLSFTAPVQKTIKVTAKYDYTIDKQSQVTVKWRETSF
jgi:hypothetical protein